MSLRKKRDKNDKFIESFCNLFELLQQVYLQTMAFEDIKTCHIMQVGAAPSETVQQKSNIQATQPMSSEKWCFRYLLHSCMKQQVWYEL